ncbi:MAG: tripartite tricarboxylate transporter substrate binding protein [Pseudomonadota bacterium]
MNKRFALAALAAAAASLVAGPALAQADNFPDKPIRIIVASAAGGASDIVSRIVADKMQQKLGQPVVVEAKPGANGNIAADYVAAAAPDGYTLMMGTIGVMAINSSLYKGVKFDPIRDFAPVARIVSFSNVLVVRSTLPVKDVKELIAYVKARPDAVKYGSPGAGGSPHMSMVMFNQMAGLKLVHVPYKGAAPALTDLMGGHIDLAFSDPLLTLSQLPGGKIRALAVSGTTRLKSAPDIPTVAEAGVPGFGVSGWLGFVAPTGTPEPRIRKLNALVNEILAMPDVQAKLIEQGAEIIPGTPQEFGNYIKSEYTRWKKVIVDEKLVAD